MITAKSYIGKGSTVVQLLSVIKSNNSRFGQFYAQQDAIHRTNMFPKGIKSDAHRDQENYLKTAV